MYKFKKRQKIIDLCGVKLGGQPGRLPTVLAGTIFYTKHDIVSDDKKGIFDRKKAEDLINMQESRSDETKNPSIIHIYGSTFQALERYIDFVSDVSFSPFIIDSSDVGARIDALNYCDEVGLVDRTIYNSINMSLNKEEIDALNNSNVDSSILLAYNAKDQTIKSKVEILNSGGNFLDDGLFNISEKCGISNKLIDTATTSLFAGGGNAVRATFVLKSLYGYPVGCGIHNAISSWKWLKKTQTKEIRKSCDTTSSALEIFCGADFVLYGPIENADQVFAKCAMADCFVSDAAKDLGTMSVDKHPINTLL